MNQQEWKKKYKVSPDKLENRKKYLVENLRDGTRNSKIKIEKKYIVTANGPATRPPNWELPIFKDYPWKWKLNLENEVQEVGNDGYGDKVWLGWVDWHNISENEAVPTFYEKYDMTKNVFGIEDEESSTESKKTTGEEKSSTESKKTPEKDKTPDGSILKKIPKDVVEHIHRFGGGKGSRRSRKKARRKSRKKARRKSRKKARRKTRRKTRRKSRRKSHRKSHRKTRRKSRRKR